MSRLQEDVVELLTDDTAVTALVSTRIYPMVLPDQCTMPAVAYGVVSSIPVASLDGNTGGLRQVRMQFDCYAKTYDGAQDVADAVEGVLKTVTEIGLTSVQVSRRDLPAELKLNRVSMDFQLWSAK